MADTQQRAFGAWLAAARGTLSKRHVSQETHVPRSCIYRAETGNRLVRVRTLRRLCDFYGVSFSEGVALLIAASTERSLGGETDEQDGVHPGGSE